jgi:hypothetical protein
MKLTRFLNAMLRSGYRALSPDGEKQLDAFVVSQQGPGGGFFGPDGLVEDSYYSWFGGALLRKLKHPGAFLRLRRYVQGLSGGQGKPTSLPEAVALPMLQRTAGLKPDPADIGAFRSRDGGYSHLPDSSETGTAYGTFLALLAAESASTECPVTSFSDAYPSDGASGLAAEILLIIFAGIGGDLERRRQSLLALVNEGGGIRSHGEGETDMLSTAVGLAALKGAGGLPAMIREPMARFVEGCWTESGGFREAPNHGMPDLEYTFYALLALGALC